MWFGNIKNISFMFKCVKIKRFIVNHLMWTLFFSKFRYTTLVERYFTYICKCFNSQYEVVRKTALVSVMKRIREEYVKLRPFILFPMLTMIHDTSVNIKRTIATFIGIDLKKKNILETFYTGLFFFLNNSRVSLLK